MHPRGKRRRGQRRRARVLRGPARIGRRVPAQRRQIVNHVSEDHRTVQRFGVNLVTLRIPDHRPLQGKCSVELRGAGISATPAGHHGGGYRARGIVPGDDLRWKDSGHASGRGRQSEGVRGKDASADRSDVHGVGWVRVKYASKTAKALESCVTISPSLRASREIRKFP